MRRGGREHLRTAEVRPKRAVLCRVLEALIDGATACPIEIARGADMFTESLFSMR